MRFIIMHKTNPKWEAGALPGPALIARVGELLGELAKSGALIAGEGLRPSADGVRLNVSAGEWTVTPGPFRGGNELPAGFTILRAASLDEAVEWAARQAEILGGGEFDIRPVTEPWDIGMQPVPETVTTHRYMVLRKATPGTEAGVSPSAEQRQQLTRLIDQMTRAGSHLATEAMRSSRRGRRFTNTKDGVSFFDGPFAETKELIGGYVIVKAESLDAACAWAARYLHTVGTTEVDVRELE